MVKASIASLSAIVLCGCMFSRVKDLDPEAAGVTVVRDTDKPGECKFLGKIRGTSRSTDEKEARQGAENDLRNQAAEKKANFATIDKVGKGRVGTTDQREVVINGKAYFCKTVDMQMKEMEAHDKAIQEKEAKQAREQAEAEQIAAQEKAEKEKEEAEEKAEKEKEEAEDEEAEEKPKKKSRFGDDE